MSKQGRNVEAARLLLPDQSDFLVGAQPLIKALQDICGLAANSARIETFDALAEIVKEIGEVAMQAFNDAQRRMAL